MVAPSTALYYPWIDIQDEEWLRSACLFWDSLRTIVPVSIIHPYTSRLALDLSEEGVLVPLRISPDTEEVDGLTDDVLEYLTDPASPDVLLGASEHLTTELHFEKLPRTLQRMQLNPLKFSGVLSGYFRANFSRDGSIDLDEQFASYYMTLLATRLSHRIGAALVTSWKAAERLAMTATKGRSPLPTVLSVLSDSPRRYVPKELAPGLLVELVMEGLSIPEDTSGRQLLEFRNKHKDELAAFRQELARLVSDLPADLPLEALQQAIRDRYRDKVLPAISALRRSLKASRIVAAASGFVKVAAISAGPTSLAVVAGLPVASALFAAAGVSVMATAVQLREDRRNTLANSSYSYLMHLERRWGAA